MTSPNVPVEQCDRDAAASLHCGIEKDQMLRGKRDHGREVQAFARHRIACTPPADEALVEKMALAIMVAQGCGATLNGERVFCDDVRLDPEVINVCDCGNAARAALAAITPSIRAQALEDAAKQSLNIVAATKPEWEHAKKIAAAIRNLKGDGA